MWNEISAMGTGRWYHAASVVQRKLYVFGGIDPHNNLLASAECYNPLTNSWKEMAPMPTERWLHGKSDKEDV